MEVLNILRKSYPTHIYHNNKNYEVEKERERERKRERERDRFPKYVPF